jgi:hypothetical protein
MIGRGDAWSLIASKAVRVANQQQAYRLRGALALCLAAVSFGCSNSNGAGDGGPQLPSQGGAAAGSSGAVTAGAAGSAGGAVSTAGFGGLAGDSSTAGSSGGLAGAGGAALAGAGGGGAGGMGGVSGSGGVGGSGGVSGSSGAGGSSGAASCPPATPLTGGTEYCSNSTGTASPGYSYERWAGGEGSGCMRVAGVDAKYSATWTESNDFLARAGLKFDSTKTHDQVGTISAEFAETYTEVPMAGKTSKIYLAVYGWTLEPLTEYYVIEDYGDFVPGPASSDGSPRTNHGTITVDGGTYDIWSLAVKNKPAITGNNKDFNQYFSVRKVRRKCGHISVSEHFTKWTSLGLPLGKLEETMFLMEAQNNSGTVNVTTATFDIQ